MDLTIFDRMQQIDIFMDKKDLKPRNILAFDVVGTQTPSCMPNIPHALAQQRKTQVTKKLLSPLIVMAHETKS